jgi:hypothetical protein
VLVFALVVAACGAPEQSGLDAQQLVLQLSDLPPGYNLNSAESFPVRTSKILAEPFSASSSAIVRRERLSGYQAAFKSPLGQPIECTAAVYRSSAAARKVYRLRTTSVASFVAELGRRSLPIPEIGEETHASGFDIGSAQYLGVARAQPRGSQISVGRLARPWRAVEDRWALPCSAPGLRG